MERLLSSPRPNWQKKVESQGFHFHTTADGPYWNEEACYRFSSAEIDAIDVAACTLNDLCLAAVSAVISEERWDDFDVPPMYRDFIARSWRDDDLTLVGRFDLAFDGTAPPKLLEYNADTPTSLLEAAVIQWHWLEDLYPAGDQFNSIHERLIEAWTRVQAERVGDDRVHFIAADGSVEDFITVNYLRDTAIQAGLATDYLDADQVGWNAARRGFVDLAGQPLLHAFKLYPWEWMLRERFGPRVIEAPTRWLEPAWKILLSNKAILAVLWELFPGHANLLPASLDDLPGDVVIKPRQSREGANVRIRRNGRPLLETPGTYSGPDVFQQYHPIRPFAGKTPVIGAWMINGHSCGIGIREDDSLVTGNLSRFVPHYFV